MALGAEDARSNWRDDLIIQGTLYPFWGGRPLSERLHCAAPSLV